MEKLNFLAKLDVKCWTTKLNNLAVWIFWKLIMFRLFVILLQLNILSNPYVFLSNWHRIRETIIKESEYIIILSLSFILFFRLFYITSEIYNFFLLLFLTFDRLFGFNYPSWGKYQLHPRKSGYTWDKFWNCLASVELKFVIYG